MDVSEMRDRKSVSHSWWMLLAGRRLTNNLATLRRKGESETGAGGVRRWELGWRRLCIAGTKRVFGGVFL